MAQTPDTTPPTVTSFAFESLVRGNGTALIQFSEAVSGVDVTDFTVEPFGRATATLRMVTPVTSSGGTTYRIDFSFTEGGSIALALKSSGTGIADASGNAFAGGGTLRTPAVYLNDQVPSIFSFYLASNLTTAATVTYQISFSENVRGVDASDFTVTASSGVTAGIASVTGRGSTAYDILVNYAGSPGGTIQLILKGSGTGIVDDTGYEFSSPTNVTSPTFTIPPADTTPPTLTSFTVDKPGATSVSFRLAFSEIIHGVTASAFTLTTTGGVNATLAPIPSSGGFSFFNVTVNYTGNAGGTITLGVKTSGSGIVDAGDNPYTGGGVTPSATFTTTSGTGDNVPPNVNSIQLSGGGRNFDASGSVQFSEPVTGVTESAFELVLPSGPANGSFYSYQPSGSSLSYGFYVRQPNAPWFAVRIKSSGTGIKDAAGNEYAGGGVTTSNRVHVNTTLYGPEIRVTPAGSATPIFWSDLTPAADEGTDFGSTPVGGSGIEKSFTISNSLNEVLRITGNVTITGANAGDFAVTMQPASTVYDSTTLSVRFTPTAQGVRTAQINIPNNDIDENPFYFAIQGTGTAPTGGGGGGATPPPAPAITSALAATATAGAPFSYTIAAANSPTSFSAENLPAGLGFSSPTISGTVAQAGTYSITIRAANASGSDTKTLVLTVNPAPSTGGGAGGGGTTPPPPSGGGGAVTPPATTPPAAQTIAFTPPPSIQAGVTVTLSATASSGLPVTFSIVSGNATLNGAELTVNSTEPVVIRAAQAGNASFAAASVDVTVQAQRAAQTIDFVSPVSNIVIGQPVQLSATASSGLPITFSIVSGNATMSGNALTITGPGAVVVRATQPGTALLSAASADITITGAVRAAQTIVFASAPDTLTSDRTLALAATASSGLPVAFEVVSGPAVIEANALRATAAAGTVTLRAVQAGNLAFDGAELVRTLTIVPATRLINLSSRVTISERDATRSLITGFVVSGTAPKRILVRGIGPALGTFGVQAALANPRVRLFDQTGRVIGENDDWSGADVGSAFTRVGAFSLATGSRDAAVLVSLPPGAYTLHVESSGGDGVALAEIYDASDAPALETQQVINLSTRGFVGTGEAVLAAGFVVTGSTPKRVLVRGIGPALAAFGVTGIVPDPVLRLFQGTTTLAENDDWQTARPTAVAPPAGAAEIVAAATAVGAFSLGSGAKDAALLIALAPGAYTATVSGANNVTGAGMIEIYDVTALSP